MSSLNPATSDFHRIYEFCRRFLHQFASHRQLKTINTLTHRTRKYLPAYRPTSRAYQIHTCPCSQEKNARLRYPPVRFAEMLKNDKTPLLPSRTKSCSSDAYDVVQHQIRANKNRKAKVQGGLPGYLFRPTPWKKNKRRPFVPHRCETQYSTRVMCPQSDQTGLSGSLRWIRGIVSQARNSLYMPI